MEIRPIRSQADYDAAVAEIERLWNADPGTDDGDKLDILATLVENMRASAGRSIHLESTRPTC
jgi:HTH-type transcriptional regulator/antitoxin HigA